MRDSNKNLPAFSDRDEPKSWETALVTVDVTACHIQNRNRWKRGRKESEDHIFCIKQSFLKEVNDIKLD